MTTTVSISDQIRQAIGDWQVETETAAQFRAEYQPIIERLERLDENVKLAKEAITELLSECGVDWAEHNGVEANLVRTDRGYYDPNLLPHNEIIAAACNLTIDKAVINSLVKGKLLTREQANRAWVERLSAPYVKLTVKAVAGE